MTETAIALVLLSAALHATWNFFNKGSPDRWAFFFGQGMAMAVAYVPFALWWWPAGGIGALGWLWIAASALTHAGYAIFLLKSYDAGDLSVAYPLSRTAPVLVVAWDVLTLHGELTAGGVIGALIAGLGGIVLQWPALRARGGRALLTDRLTRYALVTATFIAAYTIIDKQGVGLVPPFAYLYLISIGEFALIGARLGRAALARVATELRTNTSAVLFTGLVGPLSYLLILWVLATAPASYVLGLRQTSIVFGVLLGRFLLGEGEVRYRLGGAAIITAGSLLIVVAG